MESIEQILGKISDFIWGPPLLILLVGTHLYLTIRLRFIQRFIGKAIKLSFSRQHEGEGDISHFGALTTALAATIGTGNIVGVATAVAAGGPGGGIMDVADRSFWHLPPSTPEAVLAIKYRIQTASGQFAGGPMYAIERGMKLKWLAIGVWRRVYRHFRFRNGNMVQANSIAAMVAGDLRR